MSRDSWLDKIGPWSEVKLDIIRKYAAAYSRILAARPNLRHVYVDAFAGAGVHISKTTGQFVAGSPTNALLVEPPFEQYHFVDLDSRKVKSLEEIAVDRENVHIHHGDCNEVLLQEVFPSVRYEDYARALCILDPYGLHLDWEVILTAGRMRSVEIFLNFPVMDMNMNVLKHQRDGVEPAQAQRMTRFWGDESWQEAAYSRSRQMTLFGDPKDEKQPNEVLVDAFRNRLRRVAGFKSVPDPMPMRNKRNAVVYYLFFASQKPVAESIVTDIFNKYRR